MNKNQVYGTLWLPIPENMSDPKYIVPAEFTPAHTSELLETIIQTTRARTGSREPYTFPEYRRLFLDGSVLTPPTLSDIEDTPEMREMNRENPIYPLRRAFLYKKACADFNYRRKDEKNLLRERPPKGGGPSPSFQDYLGYLTAKHTESLGTFFRPWRLPILEDDRKRHTYISGKSGSRKSTLLKVLIYSYLRKRGGPGVILFDPHGDLAEEVAKIAGKIDPERVVYFDPLLDPEYTPVINPFDLEDKSPEAVEVATNELIAVFRSVFMSSGTHFTPQMEQILKPCISTLMIRPDSSLADLMDFMNDDKNPPLIQYALRALKNPMQIEFFREDFKKESYDPSKQAIRTKLMILFNSHTFCKCLIGKSTINLKKEMDNGSIVIFKLSSGRLSAETSEAMGRFYIGLIQCIAQQRESIPENKRHPVHMFIDECELFISEKIEKILKESRKYKLYLTLAQQIFGHKMSEELKQAVLGNTVVKLTGANGLKTLKTMQGETGANLEELQDLKAGEFHLKTEARPSIKITVPGFLRDEKYTMTPEEWEHMKNEQISRHYRSLNALKVNAKYKREAPIIDMD